MFLELSVGNIIGSNILDTLLPIGIAAVISTVNFETSLLHYDLPFVFVLTLVVLGLFYARKKLSRTEGVIILSMYLLYAVAKLQQF